MDLLGYGEMLSKENISKDLVKLTFSLCGCHFSCLFGLFHVCRVGFTVNFSSMQTNRIKH